jgi:hypothetical protein
MFNLLRCAFHTYTYKQAFDHLISIFIPRSQPSLTPALLLLVLMLMSADVVSNAKGRRTRPFPLCLCIWIGLLARPSPAEVPNQRKTIFYT